MAQTDITPDGEPITWVQRVANLRKALGREPFLHELLELAPLHTLTPEEVQAQAESFAVLCSNLTQKR